MIDDPDRSEQVPDKFYIPHVSKKDFTHDISILRQKTLIFDVLKAFTSNFSNHKLFRRNYYFHSFMGHTFSAELFKFPLVKLKVSEIAREIIA